METYQLPMQNLQNIGRFPVEAILQSPLYVSFLVSLLRHTNPSMLVVPFDVGRSGGLYMLQQICSFQPRFCLSMDDVLLPP